MYCKEMDSDIKHTSPQLRGKLGKKRTVERSRSRDYEEIERKTSLSEKKKKNVTPARAISLAKKKPAAIKG